MLKFCEYCSYELNQQKKFCNNKCQVAQRKAIIYKSIEDGAKVIASQLRKYMIYKYGAKCMECGWEKLHPISKTCPVELEHIDGNSENNSLSNLKLLCPSCHSLTLTYKNRNRGHGRHSRRERYHKGLSY